MNGSPKYRLDETDVNKVLIGLAVAAAGAALTYASEWISGTDFGQWTPVVTAAWAVIANTARKWLRDNSAA